VAVVVVVDEWVRKGGHEAKEWAQPQQQPVRACYVHATSSTRMSPFFFIALVKRNIASVGISQPATDKVSNV
jgi:hypothetical protein